MITLVAPHCTRRDDDVAAFTVFLAVLTAAAVMGFALLTYRTKPFSFVRAAPNSFSSMALVN